MTDNTITTRQQTELQVITRAQQNAAFRHELIADPKAVFARELGVSMPDTIHVEVVEETPTHIYLVLPQAVAQAGTELSDVELDSVAGGWSFDEVGRCD